MEIVVLWVVLSILVGLLASRYLRSSVGWFFIALLISPVLAALALLAIGRRNVDPVKRGIAIECPDCKEAVLKGARVCKHCGYRFMPVETPEEAMAREGAASVRTRNRRLLALVIVGGIAYIIYNGNT